MNYGEGEDNMKGRVLYVKVRTSYGVFRLVRAKHRRLLRVPNFT